MLVRFKPVTSIFDDINSIVNSTVAPLPSYKKASGYFGAVAMKDTGDQINVTVELPGVHKKDVTVNINDGELTITAERKRPERKENEQWIRNEISYGKYEQTVTLPYAIEVGNVSATQENGVLTIILPKHENAKPKQISIR